MKSGIFILLTVLYLAGCGGKTSQNNSAGQEAPVALLRSDLSALDQIDTEGFEQFDQSHYRLVSKVFGGLSPSNFRQFLELRLKYFFAEGDQTVDVLPRNILDQSWMKEDRTRKKESAQKVVRGAANIGTQLWLASLVAGTNVEFTFHGTNIPVSSSRAGIMLIGEGYTKEMPGFDGSSVMLPVAYRHAMLFHEARHSDCTGGITPDDISVIRSSRTVQEFASRNTAKQCGHLHIYCPRGHQFEGYAACDGTAWGSYAVGALYAKAMASNPHLSNLDYNIMKATAVDSESRLMVPLDTDPNMTSAGVRNR